MEYTRALQSKSIADTGVAISTFQDGPGADRNIWSTQVRRGINEPLQRLWSSYMTGQFVAAEQTVRTRSESISSPLELQDSCYQLLTHTINKRYSQYEAEGLWTEQDGFRGDVDPFAIIELDADLIEKATADGPAGKAIISAVTEATHYAASLGMRSRIFINQFATKNGPVASLDEAEQRFLKVSETLINEMDAVSTDLLPAIEIRPLETRAMYDIGYWQEMMDIIEEEGGNSIRLSAEWARLMNPDRTVNQEQMDFFCQILSEARSRGMKTSICLQHFTFPDWIENDWSNEHAVEEFHHYASTLASELKQRDLVPDNYLTVNEPSATLPAGYLAGEWPPFKGFDKDLILAVLEGDYLTEMRALGIDLSWETFLDNLDKPKNWVHIRMAKAVKMVTGILGDYDTALENMVNGHIAAREAIKGISPDVPVGFTHNSPVFARKTWAGKAAEARSFADTIVLAHLNDAFWNKIRRKSLERGEFLFDELGGQYYNVYPGADSIGANIAEIEVDPRAGNEVFMNGWVRMPEGMLIMGMRKNNDIIRDLMKMYRQQIKERGYIYKQIQVPGLRITESGVPGISNPAEEIQILLDIVGDLSELSLMNVPGYYAWTGKDNYEWIASHNASFGLRDRDGNRKPAPGKTATPKNYAQTLVQAEAWVYQQRLAELADLVNGEPAVVDLSLVLGDKLSRIDQFLQEHDPKRTQRRGAMLKTMMGNLAHRLAGI